MNYLAHLYLAEPENPPANTEFLIGSLQGDFFKGRLNDPTENLDLSDQRRAGIQLHRLVDSYTDQHSLIRKSKARLRPQFRRFGGIIVDVFYDHFLARHWQDYSTQPLEEFCDQVYATLQTHYHSLPIRMQRSVRFMLANDLLQSYRTIDTVGMALGGIEKRFSRPVTLHPAEQDLEHYHDDFRGDFAAFFPQLIAYAKQQKALLTGSDK